MKISNASSLAGICLGMILLVACEQAPVEKPEVVRPVRILTISGLGAGDTLSYPGEIQGVQNAELAFEVPGRLIELPVRNPAGPKYSPGEVVRILKSKSAKAIFRDFPEVGEELWGGEFWSGLSKENAQRD